MRRSLPQVVVVVGAMSWSLPALAQNQPQGCPPGSWFCADISVGAPVVPAPQPMPPPPAPAAENAQPPLPPPRPRRQPETAPPPPVVVYQPVPAAPPTQVVVVTPGYGQGYGPPIVPAASAARAPRWYPAWGMNLRVEGLVLGHTTDKGAAGMPGLGGVGLSLRYRPVPAFAFDVGVDVLAGTDYNGYRRTETPVSLGGLLYLNPRSRVQLYLAAGAHVSWAQVRSDVDAPQFRQTVDGYEASYTYFGGQAGGGFELRLSPHVALNLDALGFVRQRIDDRSEDPAQAEFTDATTGRTTNASGGGLLRSGLTVWW